MHNVSYPYRCRRKVGGIGNFGCCYMVCMYVHHFCMVALSGAAAYWQVVVICDGTARESLGAVIVVPRGLYQEWAMT